MGKRAKPIDDTGVAAAAASSRGSSRAASEVLHQAGSAPNANAARGKASRLLNKIGQKYTTSLSLPANKAGKSVEMQVLYFPLALAWFCEKSDAFADLLKQTLHGNEYVDVMLYCDEVTPGAVLAPLNNRKSYLFYLTFDAWGYLLAKEELWTTVSVLKHTKVDAIKGGLSAVCRALLHHLFDSQSEVVQVKDGVWLLRLRLSELLGDADAMRALYSAKGTSGVRPCVKCTNVLYKRAAQNVPAGYVTILCSNAALFREMSDELCWKIIDHLRNVSAAGNKGKLEEEETVHGFNWEPEGVLADTSLRGVVTLSHGTGDSMHIFYSNGTAAFEVGRFLDACQQHGLNLDNLQAYASLWEDTGQQVADALKASMFNSTQYRGSASQLLLVFPIIVEWALAVASHHSVQLASYVQSMLAMGEVCREIQHLKRHRGSGPPDPSNLAVLLRHHLQKFVHAYGEDAVKPKHHQAFHLPKEILKRRRLQDCFTAERKNKVWKLHVAPFCAPNDAFERHSLSKLLLMQVKLLEDAKFTEEHLIPPVTQSNEVRDAYGLKDAYVSNSCWRRGQTFKPGSAFFKLGGRVAYEVRSCVFDCEEVFLVCNTYDLELCIC